MKKVLKEIQEKYAKEQGYNDWFELSQSIPGEEVCDLILDQVAERYATEYAKEALRLASENVKTLKSGNSGSWYDASVDRQSILSESNLPKH